MSEGDDPSFEIPTRPRRRFSRRTVAYEGETVFRLQPPETIDDSTLSVLVEDVLERGPYRYGDWFDLPMPLYLVHDERMGDTFRVTVRDGAVELHVLPATDPDGLRAMYDRLNDLTERRWIVSTRSEPVSGI